jgi:hypothetical protein
MGLNERDNSAPGSIDPTGLWRLVFWLAFVFGNLSLLFSWLLAQVPLPRYGADLRLDYAVRTSVAVLMLTSILMARWIWKINNPIRDHDRVTAIRLVLLLAWFELVIATYGIVAMTVFHHWRAIHP